MNPIALYLASGESLYPGTLLLLVTLLLPSPKNRWLRLLRNLAAWIALALILLACPPVSFLLYALLAAAFLTWFVAANLKTLIPRLRPVTAIFAAAVALLFLILELPYRFLPPIPAIAYTHLTIIGDSLSAGLEDRVPTWPSLLTATYHIPTRNLSRPGIGTAEALPLAKLLRPDDTLLLLEIGGNDLLTDLPAATFETNLRTLLTTATSPTRTTLMFELPLLPHKISFGQIQRRLAAQFHITLLPKRTLTTLLATENATTDGLHLSPTGAAAMATFIHSLLPPPTSPPATQPQFPR